VAVEGLEGDVILTQPLFDFRQKGISSRGDVVGSYRGLGQPPAFYETLDEAGIRLDRSIFDDRQGRPER
jgi:pilus assembly protein CpaF